MTRNSFTRLAAVALLSICTLGNAAQAAIKIQITSGAEGALPIAVIPFVLEGNTAPPPQDVAGIITNDLRRSGKFEPLAARDMLSRPSQLEEVQFPQWRALGVDNLVVGGVRQVGPREYELRFELLDVYRGNRLLGKRYRVSAESLRPLAHNISDLIYEALTGQPGAFNTQIVFVATETKGNDKNYQLMLADADGERPQVILNSPQPLMSPAWSPDRKQIAYVSFEDGGAHVWVQTIANGQRRKVAAFPGINGAPSWSPDGRRLALTLSKGGNPDIYVLDLDTGGVRQLTKHFGIDTEPTWTPDGRSIVFTSDRGGRPQIYRLPLGGGEPQRLTFKGNYNANPDISADGRTMVMVHRDGAGFQIAVQDLQSGEIKVLSDGPLDESPTFAPNGAMIIYTASRGGKPELATVSVFGRANAPLGLFRMPVREAAWSPR
jgi:TolB protein